MFILSPTNQSLNPTTTEPTA